LTAILVVDDNALTRSVLTTLLGYRGHRMLEAAGGREAIDMTLVEHPELIITDILMLDTDGYELLSKLRALEIKQQPQIIFCSATYLEGEARALARACGVTHIICKPAEPEQILRIVEEALAKGPSIDRRTGQESHHQILERCMLADLDVLLPVQSRAASDVFSIVARTDRHGGNVMLSRFRKQLSRCHGLNDAGLTCSVDFDFLDLQGRGAGGPLEECVAQIAATIQQRLDSKKAKGAELDERKEDITCGG